MRSMTSKVSGSGSIRTRLLQALLLSALLWCLALGVAVWLAMREEVDELLDDTLQSAAEGLVGLLAQAETLPLLPAAASAASAVSAPAAVAVNGQRRFVWQLVSHQEGARVLRQSTGAPPAALHTTPSAGLSNVEHWRVFGQPMGQGAQMLYVAQTRGERGEAEAEIGFAVLLAGLPMVLLALLWLSARVRHELKPLQALSDRLTRYDPLQPGATLGVSDHEELRPVQAAIDALAARLAQRIAHERAFTAHAAHALRTPLAGIDAQLAVALREAPPALQPRLQRVRAAAGRLQRVVAALLALFRSGVEAQRLPLDPAALAARLPVEGLVLQAQGGQPVSGDVDLVSAALLNLLDNALRHGATQVLLSTPVAGQLQVHDDGPGVTPEHRRDLHDALDHEDYEGRMGLGLMLADLVARAHGGRLRLPPVDVGFAAVLDLGPP
jgi:signal transduction histidine kinase